MTKLNLGQSTQGKKIKLDFNCGIYKITNLDNGDTYVGSSKNLKRRFMNHRSTSNYKYYPHSKLYQAIQQFGKDKFEFQILEECSKETLLDNEQKWMDKLKPAYNIERARSNPDAWYRKKYKDWPEEKKERTRRQVSEWNKAHKEYYTKNLRNYYARTCIYEGRKYSYSTLVSKFRKLGIAHPNSLANKYVVNE